MHSGWLKTIRFSDQSQLENKFSCANLGSLGYSLYTFQVDSIQIMHQKIQNGKANNLTDISLNEFGEKSFSFIALDGYFWSILQSNSSSTQKACM